MSALDLTLRRPQNVTGGEPMPKCRRLYFVTQVWFRMLWRGIAKNIGIYWVVFFVQIADLCFNRMVFSAEH